jgi:3-hydroxyisobutyrate dehydrogenase-like beta-hydroxyacid dehydrogenase
MNEIRHTIGFIGTGIMGGRMARRLIAAGHRLAVWNRTPGKADAVDLGARPASAPRTPGRPIGHHHAGRRWAV